jgi:drug/metabolite transporter (DMT)-like permease
LQWPLCLPFRYYLAVNDKNAAAPDLLTVGAFILVAVLAGANFVAIRLTLRDLAPFWGAAVRFLPASAILLIACFLRRIPMPRGKSLVGALLFGLLNFAGFFAFAYWGLQRVQAGSAALATSTVPLLTLLLAWLQRLEKLTIRGLAGGSLAVLGILIIQGGQKAGGIPAASFLAFIAAAACAAESLVLLKRFRLTDPLSTNAVAMGVGGVVLLLLSFLAREPRSLPRAIESWASLAYLIPFGTLLLFAAQVYIVRRWSASAASYVFVLIPFVATALGVLLAAERLSASLLIGGPLILVGVLIGTLLRPALAARK